MSERQGHGQGPNEHELSEIRMLIEERTGICFDESRERFFSTRVREHLRAKGMERGTELLRAMRKSNVEYEGLLERLLTQAERGLYKGRSIASVSEKQLANHFTEVSGGLQVKPRLRKMVSFAQMNLASAVYVGRMDMIFCMNVLIYFSEERRHSLVQRFHDTLEPGGYLFLGHSESISKMPVKFQAIVLNDCILYRKPTAEESLKTELVTEGRA